MASLQIRPLQMPFLIVLCIKPIAFVSKANRCAN